VYNGNHFQQVPRWLKVVDIGGLDRVLKGVLDSQTFVNAEGWRTSAPQNGLTVWA
jgi:hypothetical protein